MRFLLAFLRALILALVPVMAGAQCFPEASCRVTEPPLAQTIVAGDIVSSRDACGTLKRITSAGAVTTSTTNTFTAGPQLVYAGCWMMVKNVGAANITLDANANFVSAGGADVVMTPNDMVIVVYDGLVWTQVTALLAN